MVPIAIAGGLPRPAWLAEAQKRWTKWKSERADLAQTQRDASLPYAPRNGLIACTHCCAGAPA